MARGQRNAHESYVRTCTPFSIKARSQTSTSCAVRLNSLVWFSRSSCHRFTISSTDLPRNAEGGIAATAVVLAVPVGAVVVGAGVDVAGAAVASAAVVVPGLLNKPPPNGVEAAGAAVSAIQKKNACQYGLCKLLNCHFGSPFAGSFAAGVRPKSPPVGAAGVALVPAAGFAPNKEAAGAAVVSAGFAGSAGLGASAGFAGSAGLAPNNPRPAINQYR